MDNNELNGAIEWLVHNESLRLPHNANPAHPDINEHPGLQPAQDEIAWNEYVWNPPFVLSRYIQTAFGRTLFNVDPDPNASPKPTWADLNRGLSNYNIAALTREADRIFTRHPDDGPDFGPNPAYERARLADRDYIASEGDEVFVHGGLDRMTGLLQMVENANESGKPLPFIRMRDDGNQPVHIHTQSRMRPLLDALGRRKNRVESAHNGVMQGYQALVTVRDNESLDLTVREAHARQCVQYLSEYSTRLAIAIAAYDPDELPADTEELRAVYVERIEAVALAAQKRMKQVLTEQGNKLPPSCADEAASLTLISQREREAAIDIYSADTAEEMKTAYDEGVTAINGVLPTKSPEFLLNATPLGRHPEPQQLSVSTLTLWADHAQGSALTRPVGLGIDILKDGKKLRPADRTGITVTRSTPGEGETRRGVTVTFADTIAGQVYDLEFTGRSICGRSVLKVRVIVASS